MQFKTPSLVFFLVMAATAPHLSAAESFQTPQAPPVKDYSGHEARSIWEEEEEETVLVGKANLADLLSNTPAFSTFTRALKEAGLLETFRLPGTYTLFVPSNEAFAKIPREKWQGIMSHRSQLLSVLRNHIINRKLALPQLTGGKLRTIGGVDLDIKTEAGGKVKINNATLIRPDLQAVNGTIHEIDTVILSP